MIEVMIQRLQAVGYSVGFVGTTHDGQSAVQVDARKDECHKVVTVSDRYSALVQVMVDLGFDLEE